MQAEEIRTSKMPLFVTDSPRGVDKVKAGGVQQIAGKETGREGAGEIRQAGERNGTLRGRYREAEQRGV